jgi:thioredoxin-dependent peroxiredoxin
MLDQQAPDFTLPAQDGTQVTLSDLRGRSGVVLIFYVMDNTPG